jgi:hypothetical protein
MFKGLGFCPTKVEFIFKLFYSQHTTLLRMIGGENVQFVLERDLTYGGNKRHSLFRRRTIHHPDCSS